MSSPQFRSSSPTPQTSAERIEQYSKEKDGLPQEDLPVEAPAPSGPPDGGWKAWLTVLGVHLVSFIAFGTGNVWGLFQDAYMVDESSRFRNVSLFDLGWIGGCSIGFGFITGPFNNILISKFGIRAPIILGIFLLCLSLQLASIAKRYWQVLLSQGIMFGLGISLSYIPAIGLPAQWFNKKRSYATGLASAGSGIGALILSPIVNASIKHLGIPWALRILGFICLGLGAVSLTLMRQRVDTRQVVQYKAFDITVIKSPGYLWYLAFAFVQLLGFITPIFFIPSYCTAIGLTSSQGANVLSVTTALNAVGRIAAGWAGDKAGTVNVLLTFNFMSGLMCVVIWIFAKTYGTMMAFAACWGFFCGAYWALSVPASAKIVGMEKLGSAVSIQFLMNVIPPIFAAPIGSQIIARTAADAGVSEVSREAYKYLIVFCALISFFSSLLLVPVRLTLSRRLIAKV